MLPVFLILCVAWYVLWIPTEKYEARLNTSIIALLALIAYNFVFQDDILKLEEGFTDGLNIVVMTTDILDWIYSNYE